MDFITSIVEFIMKFWLIIWGIVVIIFPATDINRPLATNWYLVSKFVVVITLFGCSIYSFIIGTLDPVAIAFVLMLVYRIIGIYPYRYM